MLADSVRRACSRGTPHSLREVVLLSQDLQWCHTALGKESPVPLLSLGLQICSEEGMPPRVGSGRGRLRRVCAGSRVYSRSPEFRCQRTCFVATNGNLTESFGERYNLGGRDCWASCCPPPLSLSRIHAAHGRHGDDSSCPCLKLIVHLCGGGCVQKLLRTACCLLRRVPGTTDVRKTDALLIIGVLLPFCEVTSASNSLLTSDLPHPL